MRVTALDVRDVRRIARAAIEPGDVNVLFGANASGKTSLLEALHFLGTGRSFVGGRADALVRSGAGPLRVVGRLVDQGGRSHRVGVERARGAPLRMRLDGRNVERLAELAQCLPVVALHPGSHEILAGGPGERRRLLDWALFHVEQGYLVQWQRFRRALAQRNAALQRGPSLAEAAAWESELAAAAEVIDAHRSAYVDRLAARVDALGEELLREPAAIELGFRRGWSVERSLGEVLAEQRREDRERGWTAAGPHRADLRVRVDGWDSRNRVSRGQQKLLAYLLRLAQVQDLAEHAARPVVLLDDVAAELDSDHRARVVAATVATGVQVFLSALEPESVTLPPASRTSWFHVEQGGVREVLQ